MKRRPLVALVSLCVLTVLGLAVFGVGVLVVRSNAGREQLRSFVQSQLASRIDGKLYVGRIRGGFLTGVSIDSIEIRGADDSLFLSAGRVSLAYDPRDLADRRVLLHSVQIERPWIHVRQYEDGDWNYRRIFRRGSDNDSRQGRRFGDYVVAQAVRARGATFQLTLPWHPADSLRGARRDSSIAFWLARRDAQVRRTREGTRNLFARTYRWTNAHLELSHARLADPDSAGRLFRIASLNVDESDPPFAFRGVRGSVRQLGDSIWLTIPHFDLPGSTGRASGKVVWGSGLPNRYDISVVGDSVSLRDVAWVYPTLPRSGGGSMRLHIRNDPKNLQVIEYALSRMDVRSTDSRLRGDMTFAVGGPVLAVRNVRLQADPVDFALVRTLNGKPFPVDWQGTLSGSVVARGGPLNRFVVDASDITFRDRHVPGAVTHARGKGMLDILFPAFTAFRGFRVEADRLDLRSIEYLFPNFPRLGGSAIGVAVLDSSWLDVRFRDANLTHTNGPGEPTRITGSGRVTWGEAFMTYDVALQAQPLSLPMLARAYPALPVLGLVSGPIKAKGTAESLDVVATLAGDAGTLFFDGNVDTYPPGFRARGRGGFAALDVSRLVARPRTPATTLTGQYDVDLTGDSLGNAGGRLSLRLERSTADGVRLFPSHAQIRFADGRVHVDSMLLATAGGTVRAWGALGVRPGIRDSLRARIEVDSLGGLRRYLMPGANGVMLAGATRDSATMARVLGLADSLAGSVHADVVLRGSLDALEATGTLGGSSLRLRGSGASAAFGRFNLANLLRGGGGTMSMRLDSVTVAGVRLDSLTATVGMTDTRRATFAVDARSATGPWASMRGRWTRGADSLHAVIDTLNVALEKTAWRLASPVSVVRTATSFRMDTLTLAHGGSPHLRFWAATDGDRLRALLRGDSVPLAHFGELAQLRAPLSGIGQLEWTATGTTTAPVMQAHAELSDVVFGGMRLEHVAARATYRDRRADASVTLARKGQIVLTATASLPVSLVPGDMRRLGDSLHGRVQATAADFSIIEAFTPSLRDARGRLDADLALQGSWDRPTLSGRLAVADAEVSVHPLGVRLVRVGADVTVTQSADAVRVQVNRLSAQSGAAADTLALTGFVQARHLRDARDPSFDLRLAMRNFRAIDRRSIARLDLSTGSAGLRLNGRMRSATLAGTVRVDRGSIFIPDIRGKDVLTSDELEALSHDAGAHAHLVNAPSRLVERLALDGVRVELGDEVWLRSREANVKLGGALNVIQAREEIGSALGSRDSSGVRHRLALEGVLRADRGTYTLDLVAVRREFQVERGTIAFLGTPDMNPVLDISALYRVRQADRPDIGVRARLVGPLDPQPMLRLESAESYELSQSDLVSYLVAGRPSFDAAAREQDQVRTAADVLLPTLSTTVGQYLRSQFGSLLDAVQIQAGATGLGATEQGRYALQEVFSSTRLGGEKQLMDNLFLSFSTGFCSLDREQGASASGFRDGLGGQLEYRFPRLSLQVGREPPASALSCGKNLGRGVIPTPSQWGVSLSRSWRF